MGHEGICYVNIICLKKPADVSNEPELSAFLRSVEGLVCHFRVNLRSHNLPALLVKTQSLRFFVPKWIQAVNNKANHAYWIKYTHRNIL